MLKMVITMVIMERKKQCESWDGEVGEVGGSENDEGIGGHDA